jgi:hypothetical protein
MSGVDAIQIKFLHVRPSKFISMKVGGKLTQICIAGWSLQVELDWQKKMQVTTRFGS